MVLMAVDAFAVRLGTLDARGYPVIIPTVKKLTPRPGAFAIKGDDKAVLASVREELTEKGVPDSKEGYVLTVSPRGIAIRARTEVGLFYGKKSVEWMLRNRAGDSLRCCTIEDWPDLRLRGLFLEMNELSPSHMARQCEVLDGLAKLKYNTVLCDFADNLPLSISGDFNRKETLSRADVEAFKEAAKRNHITIIPYLQVASHAYWMTRHKDWDSLSEGKPSIPWGSLYCLSNPQAQKIVETVVSETCDLFNPKAFHMCMDEMWGCPHGLCPACRDVPIAKLVWRHVEPIQKSLFARGIIPIVFQDEFTRTNPTRGQSAYVDILDWMDKRTIVDSWEYELHPSAIAYREVTERGHRAMYMSYGTRLLNAINLPRLAHEVGAIGCVLAYWLHMSSDYSRLQLAGANLPASTIWQSVYSWNAGDVDCVLQPYDANHEFARLFAPELVATFRTPGRPVALDGVFTARIGKAGGRYPAFDRKTLATLGRDLAAGADGLRVAADADGIRAVALSGGPDDGLPKSATIPVGAKTDGFSFLAFAAPANSLILKENINVKPTIGAFTVRYADGKTAKIPLVFKWTINEWNARSGVLGTRGVSRFNDANGSLVSLAALDWANPRPEAEIAEIAFESMQEKGIAPVLLAVSTHGDEVKPKGASGKLETLAGKGATGFVPLFDFSKGTLDGLRIETSNWGKGVVREIERVPGHGDVLKIVLPVSSPTKVRRVTVDFPIGPETDFGTFAADIFIENPNSIRRSDLYIIGEKGNASLIDYDRGYSPGWTRLVVPRTAIAGKEGQGAPIGERRSIRVGFYVINETPLTVRIGNAGISQSVEPGRFDIRDSAGNAF